MKRKLLMIFVCYAMQLAYGSVNLERFNTSDSDTESTGGSSSDDGDVSHENLNLGCTRTAFAQHKKSSDWPCFFDHFDKQKKFEPAFVAREKEQKELEIFCTFLSRILNPPQLLLGEHEDGVEVKKEKNKKEVISPLCCLKQFHRSQVTISEKIVQKKGLQQTQNNKKLLQRINRRSGQHVRTQGKHKNW